MTDDDAIETIAAVMCARTLAERPDGSTYKPSDFRDLASVFVWRAQRIGITPADLAGLADGTRVVVPVEPTAKMLAAGWVNITRPPSSVYRAMLAARPGAKETDHAD
jgi:hypothetical protein